MKSFSEWLNESQKLYLPDNLPDIVYMLRNITDRNPYDIDDDLYGDILDGKKNAVKNFFSRYDAHLKALKEMLPTHKNAAEKKIASQVLSSFEKLKNGYLKYEANIQHILSTVKKGEPEETAIPKLAKLTREAKYYSLEDFAFTDTYFDEYSEEEIKEQIDVHRGTVKLNGGADLYVNFKNGKVNYIKF